MSEAASVSEAVSELEVTSASGSGLAWGAEEVSASGSAWGAVEVSASASALAREPERRGGYFDVLAWLYLGSEFEGGRAVLSHMHSTAMFRWCNFFPPVEMIEGTPFSSGSVQELF